MESLRLYCMRRLKVKFFWINFENFDCPRLVCMGSYEGCVTGLKWPNNNNKNSHAYVAYLISSSLTHFFDLFLTYSHINACTHASRQTQAYMYV